MYYSRLRDYYGNQMTDSFGHASIDEAITAAKEYLITSNFSDGYTIEVYDQPPSELLTPVTTSFITTGEVRAYAESRNAQANQPKPVIPNYPDYIMQLVRQSIGLEEYDTSKDEEINRYTHENVFRQCTVR